MNEAVSKLQKIGFTDYEAKVFIALYQGYAMSAADVAKEARIPRPSVYDILRKFAKQGICNEITTPTKQIYEIISSSVIESKLEIEIKQDFDTKITTLRSCFNDIKPLYKSKRPQEHQTDVELIRGFNKNREMKFLDLVRNSEKAILFMNRFEGNVSTDLDDETRKFFKRGGKFKSIYEAAGNFKIKVNGKWQNVSHEYLIKLCEEFEKQGEEIKLTDNVPQVLAVFDERIVFLGLYDEAVPRQERSDIIIKNKRFALFITELFNLYWDKSDSIDTFKNLINNFKQ
jgi:HTH-type transcriptional regulator, sugar sensing transcriptional regulator